MGNLGMTGGLAYVYDANNSFKKYYNPTNIELLEVNWESKEAELFFSLLKQHIQLTDSPLAKQLYENWDLEKQRFIRVVPKEVLRLMNSEVGYI